MPTISDPSAEGGASLPDRTTKKAKLPKKPGKPPKQDRNLDMPADDENADELLADNDALAPKDKLGNTIPTNKSKAAKKDRDQGLARSLVHSIHL